MCPGQRRSGDRAGLTQPGGRPHAESEAIKRAGSLARCSTAYVTLEPCAHHGRTPPCTDLMLTVGIKRAVVAAVDPDPRVNGRGIELLRAAGVSVEVGCREAEAIRLNAGFFARMRARRPFVALKLATSADGRIGTVMRRSMWLTGDAVRAEGHRLRLRYDAILVGSGTALADNSTVRVVLDRRLRLSATSRLARSAADQPLWLFTRNTKVAAAAPLAEAEVMLRPLPKTDSAGQIAATLAELAGQGVTRLLVEGGAVMATAFVRAGLVDRIYLFTAPCLLGADAAPVLSPLGVERLADAHHWRPVETRLVGEGRLVVLEPS